MAIVWPDTVYKRLFVWQKKMGKIDPKVTNLNYT